MRMLVTEPVTAQGVNTAMRANEKSTVVSATPVDFYFTGAGVFTVEHDLDKVPEGMIHDRVDNLDVYATLDQRANNWQATYCQVTASGAGNARLWFITRVA